MKTDSVYPDSRKELPIYEGTVYRLMKVRNIRTLILKEKGCLLKEIDQEIVIKDSNQDAPLKTCKESTFKNIEM